MFSHKSTSLQEEATSTVCSSFKTNHHTDFLNPIHIPTQTPEKQQHQAKKRRNLPGQPDPDAEVIALSPTSLMATNRFVCEICKKGFQREQNLQLHRRGHNLPWKLKQRNGKEVMRKKVYVCPETSCVHHHASRALGDLTGIKKHFCRKHGVKKWKCEKCSKIYAVQSDCKAHSKTCGTRDYRCHCGTLFSRKDSFMTHKAFCDAFCEENAAHTLQNQVPTFFPFSSPWDNTPQNPNPIHQNAAFQTIKSETLDDDNHHFVLDPSLFFSVPQNNDYQLRFRPHSLHIDGGAPSPYLSATALLQKAATVSELSSASSARVESRMATTEWQNDSRPTRDFLGLEGSDVRRAKNGDEHVDVTVSDLLAFTRNIQSKQYASVSEEWGNC